MRILITGGAGFVGSNLSVGLKRAYPGAEIIVFDNLKRRGSELNIYRLNEAEIRFVHGDIRNAEDFSELKNIDVLIDASAEPSVLAGINSGTTNIINNNLTGTINCLEFASRNKSKFIFLSTSRVYPINGLCSIPLSQSETRFEFSDFSIEGLSPEGIGEAFNLNGYRTFYGATKLASELLITEYHKFLGLNAVINRCGVIAGPWQMGKVDQGFLTLWLSRHYFKRSLKYIGFGGMGKQVRDVLHITDLLELIKIQINSFEKFNGEIYNVGGGLENSISLKETTSLCQEITGNYIEIGQADEDREGDIPLYITNNHKIKSICGWTPRKNINDILQDTYIWLKQNDERLKPILN